jgi:hypothetical protein
MMANPCKAVLLILLVNLLGITCPLLTVSETREPPDSNWHRLQ